MREPQATTIDDARVPIGLLSLAFALTVLSVSWFGWATLALSRDAKAVADTSIRNERVRGDLLYLGEASAEAVRLAATTGDSMWEDRYRAIEPQVEVAMTELEVTAGQHGLARDFALLLESNARVVEMENRAFSMIRAGHMSAARALAFGADYSRQEELSEESITSITETMREVEAGEADARRHLNLLSLAGALVVVAFSLVACLFAARSLLGWHSELKVAVNDRLEVTQSLRELNEELESRVARRTTELEFVNHALRAEAEERKRVEEELRRQQTELRVLFDLMPAMIWVKDTNNRILRVNQRVAEEVGRSIAEIEGRSLAEIYPEDAAEYFTEDQQVIRSRAPILGIVSTDRGSNGTRWVQMDKVPYFDDEGRVIGIIVMIRDVTELKEVENALRARNELFDQLANNINDAFWVRSPDLRELRYISPGFERIWGRSVESLHANPEAWASFVLDEDRERVKGEFARLSSDAPSLDTSYRIVRPDGEIRWVHLRAFQVRGASGELINLTGIVTDITDRKQAEATRDRLAAIVEAATDFVGFSDPSGRLLYLNPAGRELLGLGAGEDVTRMTIADCLPDPATHPTATEGVPSAIRDGSWSGEVALLQRNGQEVITSQVILAHKGADGKLEYISTIIRDLTERKRLEARLFQSQKLETIGKLAGGVAHEFNSLLMAIAGQNELVQAGLPAGSPLAKNATKIDEATTRAAVLTRKLLAYGRKQTMNPQRCDLNQIIESMEPMFRLIMGEGVRMRRVLDPRLHATRVDADQLEQVLINLATNAADAMTGGGTLTLETANVAQRDDTSSIDPQLPPGDFVMIAITDDGIGMTPAVKSHLFEPFFTTKDVVAGTGLGLSACYGIIKQSGGHILVDSEPGRGTTFRIYLPHDNEPRDDRTRPRASSRLPSGTETILFVEADRGLREMAAGLLSRLGYSVLTAATDDEALALIERRGEEPIDLLLTEAELPGLHGNDAASRWHSAHPEMRTLCMSGGTASQDHPSGSITDTAFLPKPFTPSELAHKVRELLDLAHPG